MISQNLRIGQGWDRHPLAVGETLVIAGVKIETELGTSGHSDGDVLIHAVIDGLLGAVGLGDIGERYPGTARWKDASSVEMLRDTVEEIESLGWQLVNLDTTVFCQSIQLSSYRGQMKKNIYSVFSGEGPVHVKYKTADGLGPIGNDKAIDASVTCLLSKSS